MDNPFKIGPLVLGEKTIYLLRGEKGSVTYARYKEHSLGSLDIHKISSQGNNTCEWNGNVRSFCDGRSIRQIETEAEIWETLLNDYNRME